MEKEKTDVEKDLSNMKHKPNDSVRKSNRYDRIPPRFQRKEAKRRDDQDNSRRDGSYRGRSTQKSYNVRNSASRKDASDATNEEWETASESSELGEKRDDGETKNSKKSFMGQRPLDKQRRSNESRKPWPSQRPPPHNRKENRSSHKSENRNENSTTINGQQVRNNVINNAEDSNARNKVRNNQNKNSGSNCEKNDAQTAMVYRVDEIKLNDPSQVQAALSDLNK